MCRIKCGRSQLLLICLATSLLFIMAMSLCSAAITESELKARVIESTKDFQDLSVVGTVIYKNKAALTKVDSAYSQLYEFKTANVKLKMPDKLRIDGKLGMVKVEYIVNQGTKIVRSPTLKINKKKDYSCDPAKLQNALDIGLITPSLWNGRQVEVIEDSEANANSEIKLRLKWTKGDMVYMAWVDEKDLWLKRFEKQDNAGNLQVRMVYSNPQKIGEVIWMPMKVEMFAADGEKAGASEFSDVKVNAGLADSIFE